jgi:uncharacterized protein (DUF885 family)
LLFLLLLCVAPAFAASPGETLNALFASEWERGLRNDPLGAAYLGDFRFNDRLPDLRPEALEADRKATRDALAALRAIDREALTANDRINYDVFGWLLEQAIAEQRFHPERMPIDHMSGIQTFDEVLELLRFETEADYANWLTRLRGFGDYMDQTIALMRAGMESGHVPPRVLMKRVGSQIEGQLVADAESSRFWAPFARFPDSIPEARRDALREEARKIIAGTVLRAYRRLDRFFVEEYLPACREDVAVRALPEGAALYAQRAAYYTTTDLDPEAIHAIGLREVARIRAEMEKVKAEVGFSGDLEAFFAHLRSDPKFFHATPAALLDGYRAIAKRIDPELVKVFNVATMPRMPYGVRPIPDATAPNTTTAYYQGGALDGSRAGFHYVNLYKPESRPKWEMMALSLHEAVPGHHYQFAYAMEQPAQPLFRRTAYIVAYSEGWGLYAERLGYEMGLYDDPYDRFGQLTYDMWRAVRLVVDTGLHHKDWSRQQAVDYFMANAAKTEQDVVNEIDRYIAWPGQALAYKIGQLKISELRERAAAALGERFSLRDFHDVVLGAGSVPLSVLETQVDGWIEARKAAG